MKLSVISPTFNEAENVPRLVEQIEHALRGLDYEILIVDDNSPDLTWSVAEKISLTNPRVRVLRRMQNPGLGAAVIEGFSVAQGDVLACIDADLQHDPSILPRMLEEIQKGSNVVVGSRYVDGGGTGEWGKFRRLESWVATKMAQVILGIRLKDPMSGYFLVWRKDFSKVQGEVSGKGFKILLEIVAKLKPCTVSEVPFTFRPRTAGESKLTSKVVFQYIGQLWQLSRAGRIASGRVLKFSVVGGIGVIVNLVAMALLLRYSVLHDWRASAVASLLANIQNYILNNIWTFNDRTHRGFKVLKGYLSYLAMSAVGLSVSTGAYAGLSWGLTQLPVLRDASEGFGSFLRLSCQFFAVALGTYFNYKLNKAVTWPNIVSSNVPTAKKDYSLVP